MVVIRQTEGRERTKWMESAVKKSSALHLLTTGNDNNYTKNM